MMIYNAIIADMVQDWIEVNQFLVELVLTCDYEDLVHDVLFFVKIELYIPWDWFCEVAQIGTKSKIVHNM